MEMKDEETYVGRKDLIKRRWGKNCISCMKSIIVRDKTN